MAQLNKPDMKLSIGYALEYPNRLENVVKKLSLDEMSRFEFFPPDDQRFFCLRLARQALQSGQSHLITLNAANEVLVYAFLNGRLSFPDIAAGIETVLDNHPGRRINSIEEIFQVDESARSVATLYHERRSV